MAGTVFDQRLMRTLILGLPRLAEGKWLDLFRDQETRIRPYELLARPEWLPVIETVLGSSPETAASAVEEDMRGCYERIYRKPEFTDLVWLNEFRVVSARMGRHKHIIAFIVHIPLDRPETARTLKEEFEKTAAEIGIDHDFGFITPLDFGKRAVFEYDYYIDQTDPADKAKTGQAMGVLEERLDELALTTKGLTWLKTVFSQGCARKESVLYRGLKERRKV